jgi:hypothetical protein
MQPTAPVQVTERRRLRKLAILLALTALGLAHWLFGNVYEAVVVAPNWEFSFEAERVLRRQAHRLASPVLYFVPWTQISTLLAVAAWRTGRRVRDPDVRTARWLGVAALGAVVTQALTVYVVTQLNLRLFFGNDLSIAETSVLMARWQALNLARVGLEAVTLAASVLALRDVHRKLVLSDARAAESV